MTLENEGHSNHYHSLQDHLRADKGQREDLVLVAVILTVIREIGGGKG